ncbi:hypothetical protein LNTAR_09129 [Lentisphaera araneosa HTCC2155]|uniref:Uncharacterized protein n=2 Tax=Lentisphaera TaxID=256846 RepID=A6DI67_9BACT|nr:hypothetical protein LNTAR_09129 [Lentisphaera araneosa HTCC2155]
MDAWFQKSDFEGDDFQVSGEADALAKWQAIDIAEADALMTNLEEQGDDFCPWGISFYNEDGIQIHIWRESQENDTYGVRISKNAKENTIDDVPVAMVPVMIKTFYSKWSTLLP